MRDVLVMLIVFGSLPLILARPYVGILMWSWLGYMNPHRLSFGFAYDFPFALCVGIVTLLGVLISREPKRLPMTGLTVLWLIPFGVTALVWPADRGVKRVVRRLGVVLTLLGTGLLFLRHSLQEIAAPLLVSGVVPGSEFLKDI